MRYSKLDEVAVLTEPSEEILKSDMLGGARLLVSSKEEAMLAGSDKRSRARARAHCHVRCVHEDLPRGKSDVRLPYRPCVTSGGAREEP